MFIGRDNELNILTKAYEKESFQSVMIGGKLGLGKSTLISNFVEDKEHLWFTAEAVNDKMNLSLFTRVLGFDDSFTSWETAFSSLVKMMGKKRKIVIIDNLYNLQTPGSGFTEAVIKAKDGCFSTSNILLILVSDLCKSVLEEQAQTFGSQAIYLGELDYYDASRMLSSFNFEDRVRFYSCLGGIPKYLTSVDSNLSFEENICNLFFKPNGMLYIEPFVRSETDRREPLVYNSILRAISCGVNKLNSIVQYTGEEKYKVAKYLRVLVDEEVLQRIVPFGKDMESGRNGIYQMTDRSYLFWYRFVYGNQNIVDSGRGEAYAQECVFGDSLDAFVEETAFIDICQQFLRRRRPANIIELGKWWDTDTPVSIIAVDSDEETIVMGCRWHGAPISDDEMTLLSKRCYPITKSENIRYAYMSACGFDVDHAVCEQWSDIELSDHNHYRI